MSETLELLGEFLAEAGELLDGVDQSLVELERAPADGELLNKVFRGFHTIKGGAGFLEATALVDLCHRTENLFDKLRNGSMTLSPELMDTILAATGEVRRMFGEMSGGAMPSPAPAALLEDVEAAASGRPLAKKADPAPAAVPAAAPVAAGEVDWQAFYDALLGKAAPAKPAAAPAAPARAPAAGKP